MNQLIIRTVLGSTKHTLLMWAGDAALIQRKLCVLEYEKLGRFGFPHSWVMLIN